MGNRSLYQTKTKTLESVNHVHISWNVLYIYININSLALGPRGFDLKFVIF